MNKMSKSSKFHPIKPFFLSFCFLFAGLGISAFLLFLGVKSIIESEAIADVLNIRSVLHLDWNYISYEFSEIDKQPFPYLLSIVLISSIIGALWTTFIASKHTKYSKSQILAVPWISLIITSPIWGLIWSVNLRSPQYFAEHYSGDSQAVMWLFYRTDALSGLTSGWLSAIQSFPINVLSYIVFCLLLFASKKLFSNITSEKVLTPLSETLL